MDWMEDDHVVFPSPPAVPAPKDDTADEPDDEPNDPADDDQCEHGGDPDENATSKKEEDESEDDSDDESKAPNCCLERFGFGCFQFWSWHWRKRRTSGPNNSRHVDLLTQLLDERQLGLNITHIDARIDELTEDSSNSKSARRLLKVLKEVRGETMGRSGVYPEYVVKAFLAPQSQCVIPKGDNNHWDTSAMIGLYNLHKYEAVGKGNKKVDFKMVTKGYCSFCKYSTGNNGSINNHIHVHYHLVLECGFANCSVIMYDAERMVNHAKDKHKLETDA